MLTTGVHLGVLALQGDATHDGLRQVGQARRLCATLDAAGRVLIWLRAAAALCQVVDGREVGLRVLAPHLRRECKHSLRELAYIYRDWAP